MKKFLKYLGLTFLAVALFIAIALAQGFYRFDVRFFEINRYIQSKSQQWGTMVELIPDIFEKNEVFEEVENSLKTAGYAHVPDEKVWKRYEDKTGVNKFVYTREVNMLVCNIQLYVFLEFDEHKNLLSAFGTQHEHGCL